MALPKRRYVGDFSQGSIKALEYAEVLQGMAIDGIQKTFLSEDISLKLDNLSMGDFMKALMEADEAGDRDEFEAAIAAQLRPIIDAVLNPQEQVQQ